VIKQIRNGYIALALAICSNYSVEEALAIVGNNPDSIGGKFEMNVSVKYILT
jgi:hypothetical protein